MNHNHTLPYLSTPIRLFGIEKIKLPKFFWGVFLLIFVAFSFLFGYERIYAQKIFPNVKIAGINVGGKNPEELQSFLEEKTKQWSEEQLVITVADETFKPKVNELGISFQVQEQAEQAFSIARGANWLKSQGELLYVIFIGKNQPLLIKIDEEKLNQFLTPFEARFEKPQNASLKIEGQNVSIVPAKEGFILDKEDFIANLKNRVGYLSLKPIILLAKQAKPTIYEEGVQEAKAAAENIIKEPLVFTYSNKTYKANSTQIASFIKFEENDTKLIIGFSDEGIDNYLASLAKKIDIKPVDRKILSTTNQVIDEGKDGQVLGREAAKAKIKEALAGGSKTIALIVVEKKRGEKSISPNDIPLAGRFFGKYIDLDISEQRLYAFDGQNLLWVFSVSTGKTSMPTPYGTFSILSKSLLAYSKKYGLYMPYWMQFTGAGHGIHELPYWPGGYREGSSHLGVRVSHGCVRLGIGPAETIYNWVAIGTPVYIHR